MRTLREIGILEANGILTHTEFGKRIRYYKYGETSRALAIRNLMEAFEESQQE